MTAVKTGKNTVKTIRTGNIRFVFPYPERFEMQPDDILTLENILEDSEISRRRREIRKNGIAEISGSRVFVKHTVYPELPLNYMFRPARSFRCRKMYDLVSAAGISSPQVFGAGERRAGLRLYESWVIFEAIEDAGKIAEIFRAAFSAEPVDRFIAESAEIAARLHLAGIYHGDMNLNNFYYRNSILSLWDLDTLRNFSFTGTVPVRLVIRELGRLAAEIFRYALLGNAGFSADEKQLRSVAEKLLTVYAAAGAHRIPSVCSLTASAKKRLIDKYGMTF